ncbi:MAG: hypothetical protein ACRCSN_19745 [Dermatophilaceae bacterium]
MSSLPNPESRTEHVKKSITAHAPTAAEALRLAGEEIDRLIDPQDSFIESPSLAINYKEWGDDVEVTLRFLLFTE